MPSIAYLGLDAATVATTVASSAPASSVADGSLPTWLGLLISICSLIVAALALVHSQSSKRNELLIQLSKKYVDQAVTELMQLRDLYLDFYRAHPDSNAKANAITKISVLRDRILAETLRNLITYWPSMESVKTRMRSWNRRIDECQFYGGEDLTPIETVAQKMRAQVQDDFQSTIQELFSKAKRPSEIGKFKSSEPK